VTLINGEFLLSKSSDSIIFYKRRKDEDKKFIKGSWTEYTRLKEMRGTIFYCRGNTTIQCVTDEKIYFIEIDQKNGNPIIGNVMNNFMKCQNFLIGPRG